MPAHRLAAAVVALLIGRLVLADAAPAQTLASYDGFTGPAIDPARWRGYEHTIPGTHWRTYRSVPGGQYVDGPATFEPHEDWVRTDARNGNRSREIASGQLQLALTTWGFAHPYPGDWFLFPQGRIGFRIGDPDLADHAPVIRAMAATVTIASVEETRACAGTRPSTTAAGLVGVFFNDGSSTSGTDRTGDIMATLMVVASPDASSPIAITGTVWRCADRKCSLIRRVGTTTFTRTSSVGTPVTLTVRWQPDRTRFHFNASGGGTPSETRAVAYPTTAAARAPVGYVYDVRLENRPGACTWTGASTERIGVSSEARFDAVRLDSAAVAATQ